MHVDPRLYLSEASAQGGLMPPLFEEHEGSSSNEAEMCVCFEVLLSGISAEFE